MIIDQCFNMTDHSCDYLTSGNILIFDVSLFHAPISWIEWFTDFFGTVRIRKVDKRQQYKGSKSKH